MYLKYQVESMRFSFTSMNKLKDKMSEKKISNEEDSSKRSAIPNRNGSEPTTWNSSIHKNYQENKTDSNQRLPLVESQSQCDQSLPLIESYNSICTLAKSYNISRFEDISMRDRRQSIRLLQSWPPPKDDIDIRPFVGNHVVAAHEAARFDYILSCREIHH